MTKKAIITTHDGREATIVTKASNVLFEDGQTAQDILNDRQDTMISPIITTSTSMSKVGQGDSVDYSENVVDGAYESIVLKGNTKVNLIQESSKQDVVLPYEFTEGQSVTIDDTKENGALGVELKGQTLVNLCKTPSTFLTMTQSSASVNLNIVHNLQANKKYAVIGEISEINAPNKGLCTWVTHADDTEAYEMKRATNKGRFFFIYNVTKEIKTFHVYIHGDDRNNGGTITIGNLMIIEYQEGMENWDIPYFEGMQSVQAPSVTTVGKNLFDSSTEIVAGQGINSTNGLPYNISSHSCTGFLRVKSNTTYTITQSHNRTWVFAYNKNKEYIKVVKTDILSGGNFTTPNDTYYIRLDFNTTNTSEIVNGVQIEEGFVATSYEPYKTNILTVNEDVTLRGIGNVKDTLNTVTGELTQRIGEIVLDGSENWMIANTNPSQTATTFYAKKEGVGSPYANYGSQGRTLNDGGFNSEHYLDTLQKKYSECGLGINGSYVGITIQNSKLSTADATGFKQYLQQNPITVQYELATPVTSTVSLTFTNQDNQPTTKLSTYNTTTHINTSSQDGSLIPTLSHVNPTYPVILKPSTKYSIVADSYSNDHTNSPINFNLGGATASTTVGSRVSTVTTPSTLTSEKLVMSGRGNMLNNVMVIEGDVVGDEPYFEGICDCKSPILSNVGKNLCDLTHLLTLSKETVPFSGGSMGSTTYSEIEQNSIICTTQHANRWQYNIYKMKVKPSTTYHVSWTREVITSPTNGSNRRHRMYIMNSENETTSVTDGYKTTTLGDGIMYFVIADESGNGGGVGTQSKFTNVQIVEGGTKTTYEPYKSNILSCNGDKVELTQDMFEQEGIGGYSSCMGKTYEEMKLLVPSEVGGKRLRIIDLIRVKPNTTYRLHSNDKFSYLVGGFDVNKINNGKVDVGYLKSFIFTTSSDTYYIAIIVKKDDGGTISITDFQDSELMVSEVDKTIVLRSLPNGVCDTLDLMTGEYVQRIGEVVFDGSEDEGWFIAVENDNLKTFRKTHTFRTIIGNDEIPNFVCDKLKLTTTLKVWAGYGIIPDNPIELSRGTNADDGFDIIVDCSRMTSINNLDTFRQYLSQNPVTVQYELTTPIIKTVDLSGYPFSYENGHVILSSGSIEQSLTPIIEYSLPTNRNGQIRSNQKMVEKHQKELDKLQAIILANLVNSQYNQTLTTLNYELSRV